ncbi:MAG: DUF861 domain-containing protein [Proteobacteria bacterium]|nr:DUF861 domain-containing protein [Pseudomonadota bacterium]
MAYTKHELCVLLEGTVRLTSANGHVATYAAGDVFVARSGPGPRKTSARRLLEPVWRHDQVRSLHRALDAS